MKRTIALLAVLAMLLSFAGMPVSAASPGLPMVGRLSLPAGVEPTGTPQEDLNEALNVPGGTIEFITYDEPYYGLYPWVAENGYAKSTNGGIEADPEIGVTQSMVGIVVEVGSEQGVSFDFKVSCQDEANTDCLGFFVDNTLVKAWYGEADWDTFTFALPAGKHALTWVYEKDDSVHEGEDIAYLDNIAIVPFQHYNPVHSAELDEALNVPGGELEFYTPEEAANGYYPWVAEDGYAKSTNQGVDSTVDRAPPSISTVKTTVQANEGDVLRFRYKVSSEKNMDKLRFYVDGQRVMTWSGEVDWAVFFLALEPGEHELKWDYDKDFDKSRLDDTAYLDDVFVGAPEPVTGVEIQKTASVPGHRNTQLYWNVLADIAYNRNVSFASSDESIATVNEKGIVTGVSKGQAVITVTTEDGGFTDTCLVTVTLDEPPANIYGFMYAQFATVDGYYRDAKKWCRFTDTDPVNAEIIGEMPGTDEVPAGGLVSCAALVDDTVYGYTAAGLFFTMDFEAMEEGKLDAQYKAVNVTGTEGFYPTEMAYDYSTDTMYVINEMGVLYEVDMETGDLILDSYRFIDGNLPGAKPGASDYVCGFAIDMEGNAYVMIVGRGMTWGGTGGSRLASLDLVTGEYTVIGQTDAQCYQEQSMCFDYNTGKLYWAQFNSIYDWDTIQLFMVDTETAELTDCGRVTEFGAEILGMFIPICEHENVKAVEATAPTCAAPGNIACWQCVDCGTCFTDESLTEKILVQEVTLPAADHQVELKNVEEATCTEKGYTGDEVCAHCGETVKQGEEIPALGHDFQKGETVAPTETEEGYTVYKCSRCDATEKRDIVPATGVHVCSSKDFTDLNPERWYHPYTDYVLGNALMNGMSKDQFAPNGPTTRAMLVMTLYRMAGEPEVTEKSTFTDVPENQWYAKAVAWAQDLGIATGVTDTTFCPGAAVTREQAAAFLYRYVTLYLKQEPAKGADLSVYKDADKITGFAKEAIAWATAEGLFNGFENGTFQPKGTLVRVQLAKVLTILDQKF
ncbi:MAG: S-layer homology domain-containing protein [Faecousia sp.]